MQIKCTDWTRAGHAWRPWAANGLAHDFRQPIVSVPVSAGGSLDLLVAPRHPGTERPVVACQSGFLCLGGSRICGGAAGFGDGQFHSGQTVGRAADGGWTQGHPGPGVAGNLALLGVCKYANPAINFALHLSGAKAAAAFDFFTLPLGISFFTFHALSYLIDVYRQKRRAA